jgi:hypothetical protein
VIPRALIEIAGTNAVRVKGMRWLNGEERMIGTAALTAGVSCKRHNNSGNPFDDALTMTFKVLRTFHQEPWEAQNSTVRLVSGPDLERGLLKMLMCAAAAGWLNGSAGVVRLAQGDPLLLDMLYGGGGLASLAGVYFLQPWQMVETRDAVDFNLLFDQADSLAIVGMAVTMVGISIAIALNPLRVKGPPTSPYREAWRRPSQVTICDNGCEKTLLLSWPEEYGGDSTPVFADRRFI